MVYIRINYDSKFGWKVYFDRGIEQTTAYSLIICSTLTSIRESAVAWWLMPRNPDPEVGGSSPTRVKRVVSLSKAHLLPKSTGNTQEAVAPSQHDWKIVYRDVKNQSTNQPTSIQASTNTPNLRLENDFYTASLIYHHQFILLKKNNRIIYFTRDGLILVRTSLPYSCLELCAIERCCFVVCTNRRVQQFQVVIRLVSYFYFAAYDLCQDLFQKMASVRQYLMTDHDKMIKHDLMMLPDRS